MKEITERHIANFSSNFLKNPRNIIISNAVINNGLQKVALNNQAKISQPHTFSIDIKTEKVTSQKKSGRCWLFAGLNLFRHHISKKYKIKDFELSQNYPMFWDKLEKSNYFLENILETLDLDIYDRTIMWLLTDPVQDGGQWDMFVNLIHKYGVVPKYIMPETFHSSNTYLMDKLITLKLREFAVQLRENYRTQSDIQQLRKLKEQMIFEIYSMLVYFLGQPPTKFDFEYRDKDDVYHLNQNITPHEFFSKYIDFNLDNYLSIINAPTEDKPFFHTYTVKYLGNVIEGKPVHYLNLDNEKMKELTLKQLQQEQLVWFGCDVGQMMDRDSGVMDVDLYLYSQSLGLDFKLNKAQRLLYGESKLTHAMVFTGVNVVKGKPTRWKVENSWGKKSGKEGFYVMSDQWFDQYNYQVVINRNLLSAELKQAADKPAKILSPWDPMGSLAVTL